MTREQYDDILSKSIIANVNAWRDATILVDPCEAANESMNNNPNREALLEMYCLCANIIEEHYNTIVM